MDNEKTLEPGQWVSYEWTEQERFGHDQYGLPNYRPVKQRAYATVVSVEGDKVRLERCEMAKITRRLKAFGQRIDHTPYRWEWQFNVPLEDVKPIPVTYTGLINQLERQRAQVKSYPTKAQRDYARAKRRKEARK
jgi:hypothetical protein